MITIRGARHKLWLIAMTLVIFGLLLMPGSSVPSVGPSNIDLAVHLALFGLWSFALAHEVDAVSRQPWLVVPFTVVFALATETLQVFAADRTFDLIDVLADASGGLITLVVIAVMRHRGKPCRPERGRACPEE